MLIPFTRIYFLVRTIAIMSRHYSQLLSFLSIVFHNEKAGNVPFPAWIDPSWHNCLVGCLVCQRVCPQNKGFLDWVEGKELFSQEETALILEGACLDRLSAETLRKLERFALAESLNALPRNLSVFITRQSGQAAV